MQQRGDYQKHNNNNVQRCSDHRPIRQVKGDLIETSEEAILRNVTPMVVIVRWPRLHDPQFPKPGQDHQDYQNGGTRNHHIYGSGVEAAGGDEEQIKSI